MLIYILKSVACLAILFLFYKLFLEKENMHVFKRFYLLGSLAFALIVPTLVFTEYVIVEPQPLTETQQPIITDYDYIGIPQALEKDVFDIEPVLWTVYFLGVVFFGLKFLRNLIQIFLRIRKNPKFKNSSFVQVLLQENIPPHTFFKYIFLNKTKFESKEIPKEVILHEETHARQRHSIDVVLLELLQVIFWINPFIYLFKKAIKLNHEFLADLAVLKKEVDPKSYQNTLLSFLSSESEKKYQPALPNAINYSSIKKRFTVMKTKTSKKAAVLRTVLLLPLLAILIFGFSEMKQVPIEVSKTSTATITTEKKRKFEFSVLNTENVVKLNCIEGCAWKELEFSVEVGQEQLLDKFGMVDTKDLKLAKQAISNNFLISLQKGNNEIHMKGIKGTAWLELSFASDNKKLNTITYEGVVVANQFGATKDELLNYNALAEKYNQQPIEKRIIPSNDLRVLEDIYKKMSVEQKKIAVSFPECQKVENVFQIKINQYGNLKVNDKSVAYEFLHLFLEEYNSAFSKEEKQKKIRAFIEPHENTQDHIITGIQEKLENYGVAQIDIVGLEDGNSRKKSKTSSSPKLIFKFTKKGDLLLNNKIVTKNELKAKLSAKDFSNKESSFEVLIYAEYAPEDAINELMHLLKKVEGIKKVGIVGKDLEHSSNQKGATKEQLAEYNTLASKYNTMSRNNMRIEKKDVERLEYLYAFLNDDQKARAEAFPDFPEPPKPPTSPNSPDEQEILQMELEMIRQEREMIEQDKAMLQQEHAMEERERAREEKEIKLEHHERKMEEQEIETERRDRNLPEPPPLPPAPKSPLDHVIEMAKKGAIFKYKRKTITADEAIEIVKKSKNLSISTKTKNDQVPVVKISKSL